MPESDVAEADVDEGAQVPGDGRDRLEEVDSLLDRHVEDLGNGLALVVHLEGLAVVPRAMADLAGNVDVGQEVHLDLDRSVAGARLAAPALDVEREASLLVAAHLGFGRLREQLADVIEDTGVGRRVRPRRTSDRRLVDVDDLVDEVVAGDVTVSTGNLARVVDALGQRAVEDRVDQASTCPNPRHR